MNLLTLAIDELILEAAAPRFDPASLYAEIRSAIQASPVGVQPGEKPTQIWLAGIMNNLGSSLGLVTTKVKQLIRYLDDKENGFVEFTPEEYEEYIQSSDYRDAVRYRIVMERLMKHGIVKREENGRFVGPSSGPSGEVSRRKASALRMFLSKPFHEERLKKDDMVQAREARYAARSEVISRLPEDQQATAKVFSELSLSAYNLLVNLTRKRGPKDVAAFRATVNRLEFEDSPDLKLLRDLGILNEKNLLNRSEYLKFKDFVMNTPETDLMALNKELYDVSRRLQHNRQLAINARGKPPVVDNEEVEQELGHEEVGPEFGDDALPKMSDDEERAMYSRIRDVEDGTKNSSKNDRAAGYKHTFSDVFKSALK